MSGMSDASVVPSLDIGLRKLVDHTMHGDLADREMYAGPSPALATLFLALNHMVASHQALTNRIDPRLIARGVGAFMESLDVGVGQESELEREYDVKPYASLVDDDLVNNIQIREGDVVFVIEDLKIGRYLTHNDSDSEICISQGQVGIVQTVDEDGDANIDFPIYEEETLWVRAGDFDKIGKVYFTPGDTIVVTEDFLSDEDEPVALLKHQVGVIEKVEDDDLLVDFYDHDRMAWIFRGSFSKISRVNLQADDEVVVSKSFNSDSLELQKDQRGIVTDIDEDGDALIDFEDHDERQWVRKENFGKLTIISS